jgi:hypothetical protein
MAIFGSVIKFVTSVVITEVAKEVIKLPWRKYARTSYVYLKKLKFR